MQMLVTDFLLLLVFANNDCKIEHKQPPRTYQTPICSPNYPRPGATRGQYIHSIRRVSVSLFSMFYFFNFIIYLYWMLPTLRTYVS